MLADERGIALVMALGILVALTIGLTATLALGSSSQRHAATGVAEQRAFALAEGAVNNAIAGLAARYPNQASAGNPLWAAPASAPAADGSTAAWSGAFTPSVGGGGTWTLTGKGSIPNPNGGAPLTRTSKARIAVTRLAAPFNSYGLFSSGSDCATNGVTLSGGISVNVPVYVASCLTLGGNPGPAPAKIFEPNSPPTVTVQVGGQLSFQGAQATIGTAASPVKWVSAGSCPSCSAPTVNVSQAPPAVLPQSLPPVDVVDLATSVNWRGATCSTGTQPFDNDAVDNNNSLGDIAPSVMWTSSFDCSVTDAGGTLHRLAWNATKKRLFIEGSVFFDGNLNIGTHRGFIYGNDPNDPTRKSNGTMYFNGTANVQGVICGPGSTWPTDVSGAPTNVDACTEQWDTNLGELLIVAANRAGTLTPPSTAYAEPATLASGSNGWTKTPAASSGATVLGDGVHQPAAPNTATRVTSSTAGDRLDVSLANTLTFNPAATYSVWLYGSAASTRSLDVQISNDNGATWQAAQAGVVPAGSSGGWHQIVLYSPTGGTAIGTTAQLRQVAVRLVAQGSAASTLALQGSGNGTGTTVTIPAHQAGDLVVVSAYRANNTPPTAPASGGDFAWTTVESAGANTLGLTTVASVATGAATSTVTMANAANWVVHVYRATNGTLSIGAHATKDANNKTVISYPGVTLQNANGTSTVYRVGARTAATTVRTAPPGYVNRQSSPATGATPIASHDRASVAANPADDDVAQSSSAAYRAHSLEIKLTPDAVEADALYLEASTPATTTYPATAFTLDAQSIFEAGAWAVGNFTSTGGAHLGGSVFVDNGTASIAGGGTLNAFVSLPGGAPTAYEYRLASSASDFG
jgi:hypothetical protein